MARTILLAGAVAWLIAAAAGLVLAAFGAGWLLGLLPPLAIEAEALARAIGAFAFGLLVVAGAHVTVLAGLRARARWSYSGAILLAAVLAAGLLSLAAASLTSAVSQPAAAAALIGSGFVAAMGAGAYGLAAARLVGEMRVRTGP